MHGRCSPSLSRRVRRRSGLTCRLRRAALPLKLGSARPHRSDRGGQHAVRVGSPAPRTPGTPRTCVSISAGEPRAEGEPRLPYCWHCRSAPHARHAASADVVALAPKNRPASRRPQRPLSSPMPGGPANPVSREAASVQEDRRAISSRAAARIPKDLAGRSFAARTPKLPPKVAITEFRRRRDGAHHLREREATYRKSLRPDERGSSREDRSGASRLDRHPRARSICRTPAVRFQEHGEHRSRLPRGQLLAPGGERRAVQPSPSGSRDVAAASCSTGAQSPHLRGIRRPRPRTGEMLFTTFGILP